MAWVCTSSDDSSDESANFPAVNVKPEPSSESDSSSDSSSDSRSDSRSDSDSSSDDYPFTRSRFGVQPRTLFRHERGVLRTNRRRPTLPRRGHRPNRIGRNGTLPRAGPHMPSTSNRSATGRESPYRDIDYQDLSLVVPDAVLTNEGLVISYENGFTTIPHEDLSQRLMFTGPNSLAAQHPGTGEWINFPNGITVDPNYRSSNITVIPHSYFRNDLPPPLPITPTPPSVPRSFRTGNCPPAVPTVPPAIPIVPTVPPAIPIVPTVPPAIPIVPTVPPAIPIVPTVPPAIPIVPTVPPSIPIVPTVPPSIPIVPTVPPAVGIKIIKSEMISDDEDVADTNVTDVFYEVHNDASNDADENIDTELHNDASNDAELHNDASKVADEDIDTELHNNASNDADEDIDTELHNDASNDANEDIDAELHNDASNDADEDIDMELHNDASNDADEDIDMELHNDASNDADENNDWELDVDEDIDAFMDIDTDILEAQVNLLLQSMESKKQPVVARSEKNKEPLEEQNISQVMASSEHFHIEIRKKDSCDPTFGDGFEIYKVMNPKLRIDGVFLFDVQWRHENFGGIDFLEAPIIYNHWPDVALEFYFKRFANNLRILREILDCD